MSVEIVRELAPTNAAIGVSAPGIAARDNRSIAWMRGRMEAVEGLDWQRATGPKHLGAQRRHMPPHRARGLDRRGARCDGMPSCSRWAPAWAAA